MPSVTHMRMSIFPSLLPQYTVKHALTCKHIHYSVCIFIHVTIRYCIQTPHETNTTHAHTCIQAHTHTFALLHRCALPCRCSIRGLIRRTVVCSMTVSRCSPAPPPQFHAVGNMLQCMWPQSKGGKGAWCVRACVHACMRASLHRGTTGTTGYAQAAREHDGEAAAHPKRRP